MTVYTIVDCCGGEDYTQDEPNLLFVSKNYNEAKTFFDNEIANWEGDLENYDSNVIERDNGFIYECTDYNDDTHRIIKFEKRNMISQ